MEAANVQQALNRPVPLQWMLISLSEHRFTTFFSRSAPSFPALPTGITVLESCAGKKKKSEISPREENFQKEPVSSSQSYSISLYLLLQQRICPQDSLSHELHALLITDTLIMLQALTAKCHPSHTICPQNFSKPLWK